MGPLRTPGFPPRSGETGTGAISEGKIGTPCPKARLDLTDLADRLFWPGFRCRLTAGAAWFPTILRGNLEERVKALLFLILVKAFVERKAHLTQAIEEQAAEFNQAMEEKKADLIEGAKHIADEIKEIEAKAIEALPEHYKSTLEQAYESINDKVQEAGEDAVAVNIDEFIPDIEEIDHIVEIFPADITANNEPNITDSVDFTIQDIYRILCNNFWRSERIALVIHLAVQDLQIDEGELQQWLEELRNDDEETEKETQPPVTP